MGGNNQLETLWKEELGRGPWEQGSLCLFSLSPLMASPWMFPASPMCTGKSASHFCWICFQFRIWVSRLTCEHLKDSMSPWHNVPQRPVGRQQRNGQWLASCQWSKVLMWLRKPTWENWEGKRERLRGWWGRGGGTRGTLSTAAIVRRWNMKRDETGKGGTLTDDLDCVYETTWNEKKDLT